MTKRQLTMGIFCACIALVWGAIMAYTSVVNKKIDLKKTEVIQEEKSDRGHWIWGNLTEKLRED